VRRLLAFLDPLLRRPALVVEPHDGAIGELEIRHDEADAREQLAVMMLDFRDYPPRLRPIPHLIRKAVVPNERLAAGPFSTKTVPAACRDYGLGRRGEDVH
jgi:hypothetical protein